MQQRVGNAVLEFEKKEVRSPSCSSFSADANFTKNFLLCKVIWDWCISPFAEPAGQGKRQSLFPAVGSLRSPAGILLLRGGFPVLWVIELISFLWQSNGHYGHFYLGQKHTLKKRHNPTIDLRRRGQFIIWWFTQIGHVLEQSHSWKIEQKSRILDKK